MNYNLQEFTFIREKAIKSKNVYWLERDQDGFYYLIMSSFFDLQEDEIRDTITDNDFLYRLGESRWHDSWIDGIFIDAELEKPEVHFLNFKYTDKFEKSKNHFPASEIDSIEHFINDLFSQNKSLLSEINPTLALKVEEIWSYFDKWVIPVFYFHICGNIYNWFENTQDTRYKNILNRYSIQQESILIQNILDKIYFENRHIINGSLIISKKDFFEKSNSEINALIISINVKDLLRILIDNNDMRSNVNFEDWNEFKGHNLDELCFEENVRLYLRQRTNINKNIKATILDENESERFFYYNNWITITCDDYDYSSNSHPVLNLKNLQVVNWSQTIHSLFEAFIEDSSRILNNDIEVLCRIYKTRNASLKNNIAEYTNSQNPVSSRDVRSNDYIQILIEKMLKEKGYFYENKKNKYIDEEKEKRLDAEKVGQALSAFVNWEPHIAKNSKKRIFGDKYKDIFSEKIKIEEILISYFLYNFIEQEKDNMKNLINDWTFTHEDKWYILYATYYILYILRKIMDKQELKLDIEILKKEYNNALNILDSIVAEAKKDTSYSHAAFFKNSRLISSIDKKF